MLKSSLPCAFFPISMTPRNTWQIISRYAKHWNKQLKFHENFTGVHIWRTREMKEKKSEKRFFDTFFIIWIYENYTPVTVVHIRAFTYTVRTSPAIYFFLFQLRLDHIRTFGEWRRRWTTTNIFFFISAKRNLSRLIYFILFITRENESIPKTIKIRYGFGTVKTVEYHAKGVYVCICESQRNGDGGGLFVRITWHHIFFCWVIRIRSTRGLSFAKPPDHRKFKG